ncbi:MAG: hypothetical protein AAFU67_12590, partial [Bacteroidota bacterium]
NQFDIWQNDTTFHNQRVLVVGKESWDFPDISPFTSEGKDNFTLSVDSFQVTKGLRLVIPDLPDTLHRGQSIPVSIRLSGTSSGAERVTSQPKEQEKLPKINMNAPLPLGLFAIFQYVGDGWEYLKLAPLKVTLTSGHVGQVIYEGPLIIPPNLPEGEIIFQLGLGYEGMPPLRGQSALRPVIVKD